MIDCGGVHLAHHPSRPFSWSVLCSSLADLEEADYTTQGELTVSYNNAYSSETVLSDIGSGIQWRADFNYAHKFFTSILDRRVNLQNLEGLKILY